MEAAVDAAGTGDLAGNLGDIKCWTGGLVGLDCCL